MGLREFSHVLYLGRCLSAPNRYRADLEPKSFNTTVNAVGLVSFLCSAFLLFSFPLLAMLGLSVLEKSTQAFTMAWWAYPILWLVSAVIFSVLTIIAGRLGEYASKQKHTQSH